jgi:hypothetical protein
LLTADRCRAGDLFIFVKSIHEERGTNLVQATLR